VLARLAETSSAFASADERKEIADFQARAEGRDGEFEIDGDAIVSRSDDPGAYVSAWLWIPAEGAGQKD
jgi:hypothetical protein